MLLNKHIVKWVQWQNWFEIETGGGKNEEENGIIAISCKQVSKGLL